MQWLLSCVDLVFRRCALAQLLSIAVVAVLGGPAVLSAAPTQAQAQAWPQRNVRLILPFGAGSATDAAARLLGEGVSTGWGRPVVVENRPGGDALVAIGAFIAAADDHVLLYASSASFMAHPYMHEKLPYDLEQDLLPIARISNTVLSISVPAATEFRTIADFVARARAEPDKYNVAGAAGLPEFAVDAFVKAQNLKVTKVPYRDIVQAGRDLAENRIQFLSSSFAVVRPLVEAGKVRVVALGVRQRSKLLPDVPSLAEAGFPELAIDTTSGFYGPRGMPLELRKRIAADIIAAANDPTISERIAATGQDMVPAGPEELAATLKQQTARAAAVAKILGLQRKN
jgi:tripartite-type tricarboxylate transporter receptor subunit TctC